MSDAYHPSAGSRDGMGYCRLEPASDTPAVYLVHGPADVETFDDDMVLLDGSGEQDCLGAVIQPFDDADGDGVTDMLVSAYCDGRVHLVSGGQGARVPGDDDIATFTVPYEETDASYPYSFSSRFGFSLASGDLNADGTQDVIVGAPEPFAWMGGSERHALGFVSVFQGPVSGERLYGDADSTFAGAEDDTALQNKGSTRLDLELGVGLAVADLNGDGYDDLVAGAPMRNEAGTDHYQEGGTYIYLGPVDQPSYGVPDADIAILGSDGDDKLGGEMDSGQDLDGDGQVDLLVGNGRNEVNGDQSSMYPSYNRKAWVFLGPFSSGSYLAADADFQIVDEDTNGIGVQARIAGDTDGNGIAEVLVGDTGAHLYLFDIPQSYAY